MRKSMLGVMAGVVLVAGCDDEHAHGPEEASPAEDACEHLAEGPAVAVAGGEAEAPTLPASHTRYDLDLSAGNKVALPIGEAGEYLLYFADAVSLVVRDSAGEVVVAEEEGAGDEACDLVGAWFVFDLGIGTYQLEVTPTAGTGATQLVYFEADHAH